MTIVVEDGTVVTGANSYVTEAELTTYATARGITLTTDTEQLLIRAMDYIESLRFLGTKFSTSQPLQWPRVGVYVDGYLVNADAIPDLLEDGQMQTAMAIDNGQDPLADVEREIKSAGVGPVSVTYTDRAASTTTVRKINASLKKLLEGGINGGSQFVVERG